MIARLLFVLFCFPAFASAVPFVQTDKPNIITFAPEKAKFVRFVIHESSGGQPCIDELEIYGPGSDGNLASASNGARAAASSCLPGYAIHRIAHLNDGQYGNSHSWIAARSSGEWAQIELPAAVLIDRVVFSRDRLGQYHDRLAVRFTVLLSLDRKKWKAARDLKVAGVPVLNEDAELEDILKYAFACEAASFRKVDGRKPVERILDQFEALIKRMKAGGYDIAEELRTFQDLKQRHEAGGKTSDELDALFFQARFAKRRLFLRQAPLEKLQRILFVKRHPFLPSHNYSVLLDARGGPGGGICILETPFRSGRLLPAEAKLDTLFDAENGIARNPMADFQARTIYFAHCRGKGGFYHLMQMDADGGNVKQLTDGPYHDFWPCPLPDGGLCFISTRCRCRFLCWRPQAFVLYRMETDGSGIRPLSFANLSEWAPSVMLDGRIIWTRSEYLDKGADFGHTLWAIRPDGTHPDLVFGNDTINCYANGREVPGTGEVCCTLISHGGDLNGPIALIDVDKGRFNPNAITSITKDVPYHTHMSWARSSCFRDPVPISRDLVLCSHAPQKCFGLYVIDRYGNRELLYMDPLMGSMCPTVFRKVERPPVLANEVVDKDGASERPGRFLLADVYEGLGGAVKRGTIKYLRICQEVRADLERLPDGQWRSDHEPFQDYYASPTHKVRGPHGWPTYVAKGTYGLARVAPDGSAHFYAPSGKVLYFQALDENFNEVQRMRSVLQLQPGESRSCVGCHEKRSASAPLHEGAALRKPPEELDPPPWGAGPFSYEKVVQPVLDNNCVKCHNDREKNGIDLRSVRDQDRVPASYRSIIEGGWVHYFNFAWGEEHNKASPLTFGTVKSRLITLLDAGHYDVELSSESMRRIKCWIDLNCPLWPDYRYRLDRPVEGPPQP